MPVWPNTQGKYDETTHIGILHKTDQSLRDSVNGYSVGIKSLDMLMIALGYKSFHSNGLYSHRYSGQASKSAEEQLIILQNHFLYSRK